MKSYPSVAIVIPVFNRLDSTIRCLQSLSEVTYPNFNTIIVDDNSTDGTEDYLRQYYPKVIIVKGDGNQWYSGGMNLGIKEAFKLDFEYIVFLNNDNVVKPDFLDRLVKTAIISDDRTILCSLVMYEDSTGEIRFGGGRINNLTGLAFAYNYKRIKRYIENGILYETDYAGGMGILIHNSQLKDIGLFDEVNFPMGGDGEFWFRATRYKKYKLFIEPQAIVYGSAGQGNIRKNPTFKKLYRNLTNMKSGNYYKYVFLKYYRYFPKLLLPYYLFVKYFYLIIGSFILIIQSKLKKRNN